LILDKNERSSIEISFALKNDTHVKQKPKKEVHKQKCLLSLTIF